jgi:molybdopterin converting factor small subunit
METTVRVRYFAALSDVAGCAEEAFALAPGETTTAGAIVAEALARHPGLAPQRPFFRVACNTDFVGDDAVVGAGDVIALLPPFSGG